MEVKTKIIVSMGTGGVGKTTVSGALGYKLYNEGHKILLLTLDPSKGLMSLFETKNPREVVGKNGQAFLEVCCADAKSSFNQFLKSVGQGASEKLIGNKLFGLLKGRLSGAQEFTSLNQLYIEYKKNEYDYIVLDTPPLQNSKEFLTSPQKIEALFNKSFVKWMSSKKEPGVIKKIVSGGLSAAVSALSKITGKEFFDELKNFFSATSDLGDKITKRASEVSALLGSDNVSYIFVTGGDRQHIVQAEAEIMGLSAIGVNLSAFYFNRVEAPKSLVVKGKKSELEQSFALLFKNRGDRVLSFKKKLSDDVKVVTISERERPINTKDQLVEMASSLKT